MKQIASPQPGMVPVAWWVWLAWYQAFSRYVSVGMVARIVAAGCGWAEWVYHHQNTAFMRRVRPMPRWSRSIWRRRAFVLSIWLVIAGI